MTDDIYIDVNYLTEGERDIILQVLSKDEELRKLEKRRISVLKNELDELKSKSASEDELASSRICARCREPLGLIFNSGALCPKCELRVCKVCRKETNQSWRCVLCAKIREVRAESGAWFYEHERRKGDRPQLYGSALVRASFRRSKAGSGHLKSGRQVEHGAPPVITLDLDNHEKLHRPVPVHMSRLVENESEDEEVQDSDEINKNYRPYSKASPVPRNDQDGQQSDEQEIASSSSGSSTPLGSPVGDLQAYHDAEAPEETVFEHLAHQNSDDGQQEQQESEEEEADEHEAAGIEQIYHTDNHSNGHSRYEYHEYEGPVEDEKREYETFDGDTRDLPTVEVSTKWHEVAYEWSEERRDSGHLQEETHPKRDLLAPRSASPDSETTGEFFTPIGSPLQSGTGTPALSEHGQSEDSEYADAGDATPVEGERTPVKELDDFDNIGDVTVTNPEVITSVVDEPEKGEMTPRDEEDDIDHAFAQYRNDSQPSTLSSTKSLKDQLSLLSMGSRESIVSYYSDAGEGRFGNITVTGEVLFGLLYNKKKQELEVQVHRAKDIAPADEKKGKSDPYVKVYLLPDKTKSGKRKTKTRKNTLNPDFDDILKFKIGFDEMLTRTLWLALWNHDTFGHNDFLGEVMLSLDTYQESGFSWTDPSPNWYPLRERRPEPSLMSYCGDMTVALMYQPATDESQKDKKKKKKAGGKLHIKVKEARNLAAKDSNGFSDPFCKSYLLPDTSKKTKQKTPVIKKNLNPVWNYTFSYENLTLEELLDRVLELTVWDYDRGSSNDFLGGLRLGLGTMTEPWDDSKGMEIDAWRAMLDWPNKWQEFTLNLRSTMDSQAI